MKDITQCVGYLTKCEGCLTKCEVFLTKSKVVSYILNIWSLQCETSVIKSREYKYLKKCS